MPAVIIATAGAADANSYETHAEANQYFEERAPALNPAWVVSGQEAYLITATRWMESLARPFRELVKGQDGAMYYRTRRQWTGSPATTTQRLAWPRTGMYDGNGNAIGETVIPLELKWAESEFAGQLRKADRALDNDVLTQGITAVRAGSVSVNFNLDGVAAKPVPDAVLNLLPPSWLTEETWEPALSAQFDVVSEGSVTWPYGNMS